MLSRSDVVRVLARADDDLARDVDALLASVGLRDWLVEVNDGTVALTGPDDSPDRARGPPRRRHRARSRRGRPPTDGGGPRDVGTIGPVSHPGLGRGSDETQLSTLEGATP